MYERRMTPEESYAVQHCNVCSKKIDIVGGRDLFLADNGETVCRKCDNEARGLIDFFNTLGKLKGRMKIEKAKELAETKWYEIRDGALRKIRQSYLPKGWKRTRTITKKTEGLVIRWFDSTTDKEISGVVDVVAEWTETKTGKRIVISRYNVKELGWKGHATYGYNILTITPDGKEKWGDEVYSYSRAISLVYQVYMKSQLLLKRLETGTND